MPKAGRIEKRPKNEQKRHQCVCNGAACYAGMMLLKKMVRRPVGLRVAIPATSATSARTAAKL